MFFVYIIKSDKTNEIYIDISNNILKSLRRHNKNAVLSAKDKGNWILTYYEAYLSREDAEQRIERLKRQGQSLARLKRRLFKSLKIKMIRG